MKPRELLRWVTVLGFGGYEFYNLVRCVRVLCGNVAEHDWGGILFTLFFTAIVAGMPLAISYFAFRREYRPLTVVVAAVIALFVFCVLMSIPTQLGVLDWFVGQQREMPWLVIFVLPISLLCIFLPFYAASWAFRLCLSLADRYVHDNSLTERNT